jgi:hypothetical protein
MNKFLENIDEIFEALYGDKYSDDSGELFSSEYKWEIENMNNNYIEYLRAISNASLSVLESELAHFLVYIEYMHIGNDHLVRNNVDIRKLETVALKLL